MNATQQRPMQTPYVQVRHEVAPMPVDDGKPTVFYWHFTRGMLAPRMSGLELGQFILGHMPHVLPLLAGHPRVHEEFEAILMLFATMPLQAIDEVLPWVQSVCREGPDDVIVLTLDPKQQRDTTRTRKIFY